MAWNPSPKVAAARDYGRKFDKEVVLIIAFPADFSRYEIVSYGKTRELCAAADMVGCLLENAIRDKVRADEPHQD